MGGCTRAGRALYPGPHAYPEPRLPVCSPPGLAVLTNPGSERSTPVAVKIRLKRMGKIRAPFYRVVVMDSRTKRDGRAIEEIGKYHPTEEPSVIDIDMERADYWLSQGAQPTEAVAALLKLTKEGNVRTKPAKPSKKELYEAAIAAAGKSSDDASGATTPKKRAAAKKTEEPKTEEPKTEEPKAEEPKAEEVAPAADTDSGAAAAESTDADADKA
ncbi:hypothetical protein GCM10027517_25720 [Phycicoccus ginsengisoli]